MGQTRDSYEAALRQIAEIASTATGQTSPSGSNDSLVAAHADYPADTYGCRIRSLPARLHSRAAETARRINPVNAPLSIAVGTADLAPTPAMIALLTTRYWGPAARTLTVSFMENTPADLRARILTHFNAWTVSVTFAQTNGVGDVRISRGPGGYYSYLGTDIRHIPKNHQTMNLESFSMSTLESEFRRVIRHEVGHTLGFPHEHMRKELVALIDPAKAYRYFLATQGWDRRTVDQQVLTPLDEASLLDTPPDQDSIMCYQLPGQITTNGQPIRGGTDINSSDAAFARSIYPPVASTPSADSALLAPTEPFVIPDDADWPASEDLLSPV
jgi:hypothetical protein